MEIFNRVLSGATEEDIIDGTFSFPDGIEVIGACAFKGCTSLQSIALADGVELIGAYAFQGCKSLRSIVLPEGIEAIGDAAFYDCTSLQSIRFPEGVKTIGGAVFEDCTNLRAIHIFTTSNEERQRIRDLLSEKVRVLVASEELTQRVMDITKKELGRILTATESNAMRRSAKNVGFFPEEIFTEINKQTNSKDHVFYQKARREINKLVLPANEEDFKVYEAQVKAVVDMVIDRAKRGIYSPDDGSVSSATMKG